MRSDHVFNCSNSKDVILDWKLEGTPYTSAGIIRHISVGNWDRLSNQYEAEAINEFQILQVSIPSVWDS